MVELSGRLCPWLGHWYRAVLYHDHSWHSGKETVDNGLGPLALVTGLEPSMIGTVFRLLFTVRTAPVVCSGDECPGWRSEKGGHGASSRKFLVGWAPVWSQ